MSLKNSAKIEPGFLAPNFKLIGLDDKEYNLSDFANKDGLLVIFTCNHCPYSQAAWPLLMDLYKKYQEKINFVAINANDAEAYPEDSFESMKKYAKKIALEFPYLFDETQAVTAAFKAVCTPDPYLFKKNASGEFALFYHGRINDNWQKPDQVREKNLEQAIVDLIVDKSAPVNQPPSMGCSIKWKNF